MFWSLLTVSVTLSVLLADTSLTAAGPIVTTQYGQLEGSRRVFEGQVYEEFLGIPFAAPPVGDLRWQKPQPATPWEGILNATEYSIHCTQEIADLYPFIGMGGANGEDCLYLNIWVPRGVIAQQGRKLPVMFWIYGGAFQIGTGEMYPGYGLGLHGDVVVVNFNYRVNALGFLSTEDENAPGNYGLWDQHAALKWVTENIDAFAGNGSRITIFGQSAGGASVSHLMISPHTNRLFQNAIAISGASSAYFGTTGAPGQALRTAIYLANVFNCSTESTSEIVDCLKQQPADDLCFWSRLPSIAFQQKLPNLVPVVDGDFVTQDPKLSFEQGVGNHIHFITGNTYQDAAGFVIANPIALPFLGDKNSLAATNESMWIAMRIQFGGAENEDELIKAVIREYPDLDTSDNYTRTVAFTTSMTDQTFGSTVNWEAIQHASDIGGGRTYEYVFKHRQSFLVGYPEWVNGSHIDDIYSVLGYPFMEPYRRIYCRADFDEVDFEVSNNIMNYYSNFAHTGNPNQGPFPVPVQWPQFDRGLQNYLQQSPTFSIQQFDLPLLNKYSFWRDVFIPMIQWPPPPTLPREQENIREMFTEEALDEAVETYKLYLYDTVGTSEELRQHVEDYVDNFVQRRKNLLRL